MSDSTNPIQQVIAGTGAALQTNDNFASASPAMLYARDPATSSNLIWGYVGGRLAGTLITSGTITLAASTTNYVVALLSTGVVSSATTSTNWNSPLYLRLYSVVTGASTVTSYADYRQAFGVKPNAELGYTVATLPTGAVGMRAYVTDATTPTFLGALTGSGAVKCPVFHNGSAWVAG